MSIKVTILVLLSSLVLQGHCSLLEKGKEDTKDSACYPLSKLDPSGGTDDGMVFEAYLSPDQEPNEEEYTPENTPEVFKSTAPSITRAERVEAGHRGHGRLIFSKDLSTCKVDVKIEGVNISTINMFHVHCGLPGILGPILVDFSLMTDIGENFRNTIVGHYFGKPVQIRAIGVDDTGIFSVVVRNEHINATSHAGEGLIRTFASGCFVRSLSLEGLKPPKVSTVAGMAQIALERELYFNLHTTGQTYYGDMRGQIHPVKGCDYY